MNDARFRKLEGRFAWSWHHLQWVDKVTAWNNHQVKLNGTITKEKSVYSLNCRDNSGCTWFEIYLKMKSSRHVEYAIQLWAFLCCTEFRQLLLPSLNYFFVWKRCPLSFASICLIYHFVQIFDFKTTRIKQQQIFHHFVTRQAKQISQIKSQNPEK